MLLLYARVSTAGQAAEEKVSIPDQLRRCRAIVTMRGISRDDVSEYVDQGVSGGTAFTKRPNGARLWADMQAGDIVVAAKLDRMFRSASDALTMLERFKERGVRIVLLDLSAEPIGETPISEALFGMIAIFASLERRMINERTQAGRAGKRAKSGFMGGVSAPYGWKVEGRGKLALLTENPDEQHVIEIAMRCHKQSKSAGETANRLNSEGYRTRTGREFQMIQVMRIWAYQKRRRAWSEAA